MIQPRQGVRSIARQQSSRTRKLHTRIARRREEKGYVMVMTAILLPLLLTLVSAATDVTYFYARGVEVQRLADTAALAGVVRMPNLPDAQRIARQVAKQNAAQNNLNNITVSAESIPGTNRQIKVTVRDAKVKLFFGRLFKDSWDISKTATAEYVSNIPLGSVLNAIGSGDLTGTDTTGPGKGMDTTPQNFWLTVHGPCAAKEQGDMFSTRYDGTNINTTTTPADLSTNRHYRICDFNSGQTSVTDPTALFNNRIAQISAEKTAAPANLFPGVSLNRDYDDRGYNYIVDIPCSESGGVVLPAPCVNGDNTTQDITIEVFDPVFNPDSLQNFQRGGAPKIKPDSYGVRALLGINCTNASFLLNPTTCTGATPAAGQVRPADVRVTTNFRVYPADETPVDYSDDVAMPLTNVPLPYEQNVINGIDPNGVTEPNAVAEFRTCLNATDPWASVDAGAVISAADANHDYIPDVLPTGTPEPVAQIVSAPNCDKDSLKWRPLVVIPANSKRGKYRVNVRTVSSAASFGANAFSIRASKGAFGSYAQCKSVTDNQCPSVSGDSTMSVSASVPNVAEFYLAQLTPAALFRGKTVVLNLWDIGEGGDQIEVLRPIAATSQCSDGSESVTEPTPGYYCKQRFNWAIDDPGVNDPTGNALDPVGASLGDPCSGIGEDNKLKLSVAGNWNTTLTGLTPGCTASISPQVLGSRAGYSNFSARAVATTPPEGLCSAPTSTIVIASTLITCEAGRFNGRLVALQVQIPLNYGCNSGTGPDAVTGVTDPTKPCVDSATPPQGGWWKIRYTPLRQNSGSPFLSMTDATTWSVQLIGDPVHLVQNG